MTALRVILGLVGEFGKNSQQVPENTEGAAKVYLSLKMKSTLEERKQEGDGRFTSLFTIAGSQELMCKIEKSKNTEYACIQKNEAKYQMKHPTE